MATTTEQKGARVLRRTFSIVSAARRQALDITPQVLEAVLATMVDRGMVLVSCIHTTCSVIIVERGLDVFSDLAQVVGRFVEARAPYRHNDPQLYDCERGNAAAHLPAALLGHGVVLGIADHQPLLDTSQAILLAEWDGPRTRNIDVQVMGA